MSNINHISQGSINLSYRELGNLLASFDRNDSAYDETEFYKLVLSIFNHIWSRETAQSLLASPSVTLEIDNIDSLQFAAEPNQNIFGEDSRLAIDPSAIKCVSKENVKLTSKRVLQNVEFSVDKLLPLFQVPHHKLNNPSKSSISGILFNVLDTISNYLDLTCEPERKLPIVDSPLFLPTNPTSASITPDYCICDQRQNVVCVVNIKPPNLFSGIKYFHKENHLCDGGLAEIMIELQICMIAARSRFGVLCDGHHLILVELDDNLIYYQERYLHILPNGRIGIWLSGDKSFTIPLNTLLLNLHSIGYAGPSFLEGLTYFFYQAKQAELLTPDSPVYKYLRLAVQPRHISNQEEVLGASCFAVVPSPVPIFGWAATYVDDTLYKFVDWRNGEGYVHRHQYHTSIKIRAKYLKDVIKEDIGDEEYVVMKILESKGVRDENPYTIKPYNEMLYQKEWNIIRTLENCREFNNIYLQHPKLRVQYLFNDFEPITGYAIIRRYLEPNPIPLDSYKLAKHQVEIIHKAGVVSLTFKNGCIYFSDGKFYLYGFNHSVLVHNCESNLWKHLVENDFCELKKRFKIEK